jgi:hypothetical protein
VVTDADLEDAVNPFDDPVEAMTDVLAGMITHPGIALAEASPDNREGVMSGCVRLAEPEYICRLLFEKGCSAQE